ncbi:MAG: hypothetical protein ACQGQO_01115 [Sphaerochaetaceae bacterium]
MEDKQSGGLVVLACDACTTEVFYSLKECRDFYDIRYSQDLLRKIYTGATADDGITTFDIAIDSPYHVTHQEVAVTIKGKRCKRWMYVLRRDDDAQEKL